MNQIESIHEHRDRDRRVAYDDEYDERKRPRVRPSVRPSVRASVTVERTETDRPMRTTREVGWMDGWMENARASTNAELYFFVTSYKAENDIGTHFLRRRFKFGHLEI